jgi:CubicO group peptidase (beta-lactamase class C family)
MADNKEQAGRHAWQTALGVLALLIATVGGQAVAGEPAISEHGSSLTAAFDRAAAVVKAAGLPGELVVTDAAGAERSAAFGMSDRTKNVPNRVGQRWLWASVTKQVTATLVMQEVAGGRIDLDVPIGRYLPDFGGDHAITVRELLQHRSGLPNPSDTPEIDGVPGFYRQFGPGISDTARTAGFCAAHPKGQRGGQWEYNNCDYLVLGAVLKAATGSSYAQLVQERVNKPLKIRTRRLARDRALHGGAAAIGYIGTAPVPAINVATGGPAAALTGSASDLARFDRGLMTGRLLAPAARTIAWAGDPKLGFMALGVWSFTARLKGCAEPIQLVERRGDFGGTQARNVIAPAMGRAVILFTNDDAAEFGEVWQGKGLTYELLSAALCPSPL